MLFDRLQEGGPFFMYPLAILLILVIILIVKGLLSRGMDKKTNELISSITLSHRLGLSRSNYWIDRGV